MTEALRKSLTHSAKLALDLGAFALARRLLDSLEGICEDILPETELDPVSARPRTNAERQADFRKRNGPRNANSNGDRYESNDASVTPSVTSGVTVARSLSLSSSDSSSHGSSPEDGSDLEERGRARNEGSNGDSSRNVTGAFVVPESWAVPELLANFCEMHYGVRPTAAHVASYCANERRKPTTRQSKDLPQLREGLKLWMEKQKAIDATSRERARTSAKPVQPTDPNAPWMKDGYGVMKEEPQ